MLRVIYIYIYILKSMKNIYIYIYIYILKSMKNENLPFLCFCAMRFTAVAAGLRMCTCAHVHPAE